MVAPPADPKDSAKKDSSSGEIEIDLGSGSDAFELQSTNPASPVQTQAEAPPTEQPAAPAPKPPAGSLEIDPASSTEIVASTPASTAAASPTPTPAVSELAPPSPAESPSIPSSATPPSSSGSALPESDIPLRVQPKTRKPSTPIDPLVLWDITQLSQGKDKLGQGIAMVMAKAGVTSALFLSITPPPAGAVVPIFKSTATIQPSPSKLTIWTGLKWDPAILPELWNNFIRAGQVEFTPPGAVTNQKSNRNIMRSAFGILQSEWLLIVRAGPATSCRGVVAFVSTRSIVTEIHDALPLLSS